MTLLNIKIMGIPDHRQPDAKGVPSAVKREEIWYIRPFSSQYSQQVRLPWL
jgi:hypothetical protein